MEAILRLCTHGVFFDSGTIRTTGDINTVVAAYLNSQSSSPRVVDLSTNPRPLDFLGEARLIRVSPTDSRSGWSFPFDERLSFDLAVDVRAGTNRIQIGFALHSIRGFEVASWTSKCNNQEHQVRPGINTFRISFLDFRLLPGRYFFDISVWGSREDQDRINDAVRFEITSNAEAAKINAERFGGAVVPSVAIEMVD